MTNDSCVRSDPLKVRQLGGGVLISVKSLIKPLRITKKLRSDERVTAKVRAESEPNLSNFRADWGGGGVRGANPVI